MASQPAADVGQPSGAGTVNWRATDALNAPNCKKMNNHFQNINFKNIAIPLIICISASACGSDESLDGRKFGRDYDNIFLPIDKIVANKSGVLYLSYINNIYGNSKVCINREYSRVKIDNEEIMQIPRVGYVKENSIVISVITKNAQYNKQYYNVWGGISNPKNSFYYCVSSLDGVVQKHVDGPRSIFSISEK